MHTRRANWKFYVRKLRKIKVLEQSFLAQASWACSLLAVLLEQRIKKNNVWKRNIKWKTESTILSNLSVFHQIFQLVKYNKSPSSKYFQNLLWIEVINIFHHHLAQNVLLATEHRILVNQHVCLHLAKLSSRTKAYPR